MKPIVHVSVVLLLVWSACLMHAQVPRTLFYQGVLSDSTGAAKPDGPYLFTFRLYEASSGGTAVGTQQQTLQVKRGLFYTVFDQLLNGLTIDHPFWFTVQVQNEAELSPRIPFTSVPYSISSIRADTARYALTVASNAGWSINGNTISYTNGNVGIGTDTVGSPFVVRGGSSWGVAEVIGNGTNAEASIGFRSSNVVKGGVGNWILGANNNGGLSNAGVFSLYAANGLGAGSQVMSILTSGNVGIGRTVPSYKLDVNGIINATDIYKNGAPFSAGNQWSTNGSNISYSGGNVGIGTSTPGQQLEITGNIRIPHSTSTAGILYSDANTFIHNYGTNNFFAGVNAGNLTMTGISNTVVGSNALNSNTSGSYNTASGLSALFFNTSGNYNTASGYGALNSNTSGHDNTASGVFALSYNHESYNSAYGVNALNVTLASQYNVAVGYNAGGSHDNGYNNVFIGANTDVNGVGYYNVIAIGKGTVVTGPSAAVFGNSSTVSYSGYANWSNISDGRYKKNIRDNVPGLNFITKLRPVTYNLDATGLDAFLHKNDKEREQGSGAAKAIHNRALHEKEAITYTGFVAQEVEAAAKELGYDFSGVDAPRNENGTYGLRYAEFVVPLVKAVQEQQKLMETQQKEIEELKAMVKSLAKQR